MNDVAVTADDLPASAAMVFWMIAARWGGVGGAGGTPEGTSLSVSRYAKSYLGHATSATRHLSPAALTVEPSATPARPCSATDTAMRSASIVRKRATKKIANPVGSSRITRNLPEVQRIRGTSGRVRITAEHTHASAISREHTMVRHTSRAHTG
jgi:hypothetical protein